MRHFVQYHNAERYGPAVVDLIIHTSRPVQALPGNMVWLIAGAGRPREYRLLKVFVVDEIGPLADDDFAHYARGSQGKFFAPGVLLSGRPTFSQFLRSQANFSLGLREIRDRTHVAMLQAAAVDGGYAPPG